MTFNTGAFVNAGRVADQNWGSQTGTPGLTTSSFSSTALAANARVTTQTLTFSGAVVNPYLLFNYTDPTTTMRFAGSSVGFFSSNNAQLSGTTVTFNGSSDLISDGFAIELLGTYGPSNALTFDYSDSAPNGNSVAFTVGVLAPTSVPEPSSVILVATGGLIALGSTALRRRQGR